MNTAAKVRLSPAEMQLVTDPEWILTKNSIIGKVVALLAALGEDYRVVWESAAIDSSTLKITRGENYKGLPWVVLDYPRNFGKEDILAIRTLFWWGRHFSITLHLKGRYKELYGPVILANWEELAAAGFHIGISDNEWQHEHTPDNYRPMDGGVPHTGHDFLKLSAACGLDKWEEAPEFLLRRFETLTRVLNSPAGETGL